MFKNTPGYLGIFLYDSDGPVTGEAANVTVYYSHDDGTTSGTLSGTVTEVDATNQKGQYRIDHTAAEANCDLFQATPVCSTGGVTGAPIELFTQTPMRGTDSAALASDYTSARAAKLDEITSARMAVLTDWINGGRLDLILDAIAGDVVNIDGAAMRGTDNASTFDPSTATVDTGFSFTATLKRLLAVIDGDEEKDTSGDDIVYAFKDKDGVVESTHNNNTVTGDRTVS